MAYGALYGPAPPFISALYGPVGHLWPSMLLFTARPAGYTAFYEFPPFMTVYGAPYGLDPFSMVHFTDPPAVYGRLWCTNFS